jgi:uncharacterized protein DUF4440
MTTKAIVKTTILILALHLCVITLMSAQGVNQAKKETDLYNEIASMDSVLFTAFNNRDTVLFKTMFTNDLEFYHDKGGLSGYDNTVEFMRATTLANNGLKRELVKQSLEVYPIPNYGAMEIGVHTFCHLENGKPDCGTFKFVHIWLKKDGTWKISRVVSYGH